MRFSKTWRYLRLQIFLSREGKIVYLYLKNNWNSNFTKLSTAETKILTTSQTKNAQASQTSSFGIFTSPRPILLASGTGPPTNFEDCKCNRLNYNHFVNVIDYITDYI